MAERLAEGIQESGAALAFYVGPVMHARLKPRNHRFTYPVFSIVIDPERLEEAARSSRFFAIGRFNLMGFDPRDHGARDGAELAQQVRHALRSAGLTETPARLALWCYPRVLGFVFNPIAVHFAYAADERLIGVIYEVRNTFGDRHCYVAPVRDGEWTVAGLRQERDKIFYVSPFLDMAMRYRFRIRPPGATLAVRILEEDATGPILAATFHGERREASTATILHLLLTRPLMTLGVVLGIHWEAAKLWFKGVRFHHRPAPPPTLSLDGRPLDLHAAVAQPSAAPREISA